MALYTIAHYESSIIIIEPVPHTTYGMRVNFKHKSTPNDRFVEKFFIIILHLHSYKVQLTQQLKPADPLQRRRYI